MQIRVADSQSWTRWVPEISPPSGRCDPVWVSRIAAAAAGARAASRELVAARATCCGGPQVIPGYDLRPCHCAWAGHIGRSVYLPWGTIVRGQNVSYVPTSHGSVGNIYTHK
jgi:hypothetical protein